MLVQQRLPCESERATLVRRSGRHDRVHADDVADGVVRGHSVEPILDAMATPPDARSPGRRAGQVVQALRAICHQLRRIRHDQVR